MGKFKEHEDTSRLWCLAILRLFDTETVGRILAEYLQLRDNDPDKTLRKLKLNDH